MRRKVELCAMIVPYEMQILKLIVNRCSDKTSLKGFLTTINDSPQNLITSVTTNLLLQTT